MAKVRMPLLSAGASGSVAGSLTFTEKYGNNYVGKKIIRNLSNTALQQTVRNLGKDISVAWNALSAAVKLTWSNASTLPGVSGYNYFYKKAMEVNGGSAYNGTFTAPTV